MLLCFTVLPVYYQIVAGMLSATLYIGRTISVDLAGTKRILPNAFFSATLK